MIRWSLYFKKIISKWFLILFLSIFSFFSGYFIASQINYNTSTCYCDFQTNEVNFIDNLLSFENLEKIYNEKTDINGKNSNYGEIDITSLYNKKAILIEPLLDNNYRLITYTKYYDQFFLSKSIIVSTRAKNFVRDLLQKTLGKENVSISYENIIHFSSPKMNTILFSFEIMLLGITTTILIIVIKKEKIKNENYDIYLSPFKKQYWKDATKVLSSTKKIAAFAMILSLLLLSKFISLPSGFGALGLSLGYLFISIISIIFGPLGGILIGFLSDILGYFFFNSAGTSFFIGYTFQAMLAGFSYGIFLYHTRITFIKVFFNRLFVNLICNVLIGSICWGIVVNYNFQQTMGYMLLLSLPKNIVYLIPQSILLYLVLKAVLPIIARSKLIDERIAKNISLI